MSDAPPDAPLVRLQPSVLRGATDGPVPFAPRAFGAVKGQLVARDGKEGGTFEVDGVRYPLQDGRSKAGRTKHPLVRLEKPSIVCVRPVDFGEGLVLRLVGLRKALEDPGLTEVVGTIAAKGEGTTTVAVGPDRVTLVGAVEGAEGDMVQAFARLGGGKLTLTSAHRLEALPPA